MTNSPIVDDLVRASAVMGDMIDRIAGDQWTAATPCTEWSVRDVVSHLVGVNLAFVAMFEEGPMPDLTADCLGADPAGAYRRSTAALLVAAVLPRALERSSSSWVGVASGAVRLQWRIADLIVHGWDLAQPTGVAATWPDDLVEQALAFARAHLPDQSRAGRFADPQPIRDDAPALDRLAAFTGRPVPWTP
ncbi:TIGR03086 family metal-binding protein [Streptomyces sp. NPDC052000]|uniref:TIGR03086 family metal-binding protein n=1 Tax=Streptomyces sp. NPDC052000 TaxID=3155676 RepID=UPI00344FF6F1